MRGRSDLNNTGNNNDTTTGRTMNKLKTNYLGTFEEATPSSSSSLSLSCQPGIEREENDERSLLSFV